MPMLSPPGHPVSRPYLEDAARQPLPLSPITTTQPPFGYVVAHRIPSAPPYFPPSQDLYTVVTFEVTSPGFVDGANGTNIAATLHMNAKTHAQITTATSEMYTHPPPPRRSPSPP